MKKKKKEKKKGVGGGQEERQRRIRQQKGGKKKDLWEKIWDLEIEQESESRGGEKKPITKMIHSETKYSFGLKD